MKTDWLNKSEYPFSHNFFEINNHAMHYIDEGEGEIILFVHGTPSWSFDFRHVIKTLKNNYRCIAVDHIGFGLSDKPADYDYSTMNHSSNLEKFIMDKNLRNITLVVHDFGGPIALNMAIRHPERIKNIVILNSWLWSSRHDADFIKLSKILRSPLLPFLYKYFNFSPKYIMPKSFGDKKLSRELLSQYSKPFSKPSERNGPIAFAKSLLEDQDWFEELWQNKTTIEHKPTLFIWGMKDPVIKPAYLEKFASGFTNARIEKIPTAGHFPQEEEHGTVARCIDEMMSSGQ